ncbi:MAG: hypothetical protein Q9186_007128 [Xanthomendoza sp. 1 TL-2023]
MRHIVFLLNLCILLYICQSRVVPFVSPQAGNKTPAFIQTPSASRKVYTFTHFALDYKAISRDTGRPVYGGHSEIWIEGTQTDGPLVIELGFSGLPRRPGTSQYAVNSKDLGIANTGKPFTPPKRHHVIDYTVLEGETFLTNAEMFDHAAGTGLIADAWNEDPLYRMGTGSTPNTCYDLSERILRHMKLDLDPLTRKLFDNSTEYYTSHSRKRVERVQEVASIVLEPAGPSYPEDFIRFQNRIFNVDFVRNPDAPNMVAEITKFLPGPALLTATGYTRLTAVREDLNPAFKL